METLYYCKFLGFFIGKKSKYLQLIFFAGLLFRGDMKLLKSLNKYDYFSFLNKAFLIAVCITICLDTEQTKQFVIISLCKREQTTALNTLSFLVGVFSILRIHIVKAVCYILDEPSHVIEFLSNKFFGCIAI